MGFTRYLVFAAIAFIILLFNDIFLYERVQKFLNTNTNPSKATNEEISKVLEDSWNFKSAAGMASTSLGTKSKDDSSVPESTGKGIWSDMSTSEQKRAYEEIMFYLQSHARKISSEHFKKVGDCELELFGKGYGGHYLCSDRRHQSQSCNFLSFGIADDYTFDTDLATNWNCRGITADPTIIHQSKIHPLVTFHNIAANMIRDNAQRKKQEGGKDWWIASVPSTTKFFKLDHMDVLKLDCEGCEYAVARDVLAEEPDYFQKVDQVTMEVHLSKAWLNDAEQLYYLGMLLKLLDDAGLKLQYSKAVGCALADEEKGCMEELIELGFPCGNFQSCHNYLFAKDK